MAIFEGVHENLLQGVSQQVPRSRLPGQVTAQENFISDPVTGLRRRPGSKMRFIFDAGDTTYSDWLAWRTDISGVTCECLLNVKEGILHLIDPRTNTKMAELQHDYLKAEDIRYMRNTVVGDSLFIANISRVPTGVRDNTNKKNPLNTGFFYVQGSDLRKQFEITVSVGSQSYTATYTTPDGSEVEHVEQVQPDYIAQQLHSQIVANFGSVVNAYIQGTYVFLEKIDPNDTSQLTVTSGSGTLYIKTSGASSIRQETDLPRRLPNQANNVVVKTGLEGAPTYYRYEASTARWIETSAYDSVDRIENAPIEVFFDAYEDKWVIDDSPWLGRLSGDDITNPDPDFVDWGITGIGAYQGRMVILTGPWVWLSATNKPRQFYRTTVDSLLDTDPIGVGSSSVSSAAFHYAIPFNKDLILFSSEYQALIPGGSRTLTPGNTSVVVTSTYSADMNTPPVTLGHSVVYPTPRSSTHFGVLEMLPSPYTDSQYISSDATEHIPRYLPGRCRFVVSSPVANIAVFGSTTDRRALYVHEYMWSGDEKVLSAWHRWQFAYDVAYAYFSGELINIVTVNNGVLMVCSIDPRTGTSSDGSTTGYLDYYTEVELDDFAAVLPELVSRFHGDQSKYIRAMIHTGPMDGYEIGVEVEGSIIRANRSNTAQSIRYGRCYRSTFSPSPPIVKGDDGLPISTGRLLLVNYFITTDKSGPFKVSVRDTATQTAERVWEVNPMLWYSTNLALGTTPISRETGIVIPCRVAAQSSHVVFSTNTLQELNILSLEYRGRFNQRFTRR